MYCIQVDIPQNICDIDDELKAIYHSKDTVCMWVFITMDTESVGGRLSSFAALPYAGRIG
jgi:hypothetical protein